MDQVQLLTVKLICEPFQNHGGISKLTYMAIRIRNTQGKHSQEFRFRATVI